MQAVRTGSGALSLGQKLATFGTKTMEEAQAISRLENPVVGWLVRGASDTDEAGRWVAGISGGVGLGTGGVGLGGSLADADDDGIKDGSVAGIDGSRLIFDNAGILNLVNHVF